MFFLLLHSELTAGQTESVAYRAVIVDDEAPARALIRKYLEDFSEINIVAECENGFTALKAIQTHQPDFIFLDIQMPKLTGFEMLELLENPPAIIFTTAYDQYALKAFEVSAADYLLKPFSKPRFAEAIEKAKRLLHDSTAREKTYQHLLEHHAGDAHLERIVVKDGGKITVIPTEKLIRIAAMEDYVMLHTDLGKFLKLKTMKYFEAHLDPAIFIRVHRSHIVRISAIKQLEPMAKGSYELRLADGSDVPVSKSGYQRLKSILST